MRYVFHIINLVVVDGLKDMHNSVVSIRNAARYVRFSPAHLNRFKECVEEENIESKSLLCLNVQTKWNSTYLMLEAALKFQKAFERLEGNLNYLSYFCDDLNGKSVEGPPLHVDWKNAKVFVNFLRKFYEMTLQLNESLYTTSNMYLDSISNIQQTLSRVFKNRVGILATMMENIQAILRSIGRILRK